MAVIYKTFKGTNSEYRMLHYWVEKQLGKPSHCVNCETLTAKRYEWANVSGDYLKDISDWERLCTRCHRLIDFQLKPVKPECQSGHAMTPDNTYTSPDGTHRACRTCRRKYHKVSNSISNPNRRKNEL